MDELLTGVNAFSASEDTQWISIGIMGSVPKHPLFQAVIEELPRALSGAPNAPVNEQTGPLFFTRVVTGRRLKKLDSDFVVYPPAHFYPYRIGEEHLRAQGFPDAYAVHHWAGSWLKQRAPGASSEAKSRVTQSTPGANDTEVAEGEVPRILLGFNPEAPQAALSILQAYQSLFSPGDAVELGLYAYAEPSMPLLQCIQELMTALVGSPDRMAPLALLSRAELGDVSYQAAFFPSGDELTDARSMAQAVQALCALRAQMHSVGPTVVPLPERPARDEILQRSAEQPQAAPTEKHASPLSPTPLPESPPPTSNAPQFHGTALGNGRMLIQTTRGTPLLSHSSDLSLTPELLMHGEYDRPLTQFLKARLAPGHVAFDVGANIGLFTVQMAQQVGPTGHVVAYEALPHNYQILSDNIGMNYQGEHCSLLRGAAWNQSQELEFQAPTQFLGNGSALMNEADYRRRYPGDSLEKIQVQGSPLSEQLAKFKQVELVKVDVEGAELKVLEGMGEALFSGQVRSVVF